MPQNKAGKSISCTHWEKKKSDLIFHVGPIPKNYC